MKGFDFDGVITAGIRPSPEDVIITGRSIEEWEDTYKLLKSLGITNTIHFNPVMYIQKTRENAAEHKAKMINYLGVSVFFEDDPLQVHLIRGECPNVMIYHVNRVQ